MTDTDFDDRDDLVSASNIEEELFSRERGSSMIVKDES